MNEQPTERPKCCPNCGREETEENYMRWCQDPFSVEMGNSVFEEDEVPFEWMCDICYGNSCEDI